MVIGKSPAKQMFGRKLKKTLSVLIFNKRNSIVEKWEL